MIQQMKRDFFSLKMIFLFFTFIVPALYLVRNEFTTMGLLLSAFVVGMLVMNDEKFKLNKFFNSMPVNPSSLFWGRVTLVSLFGILWVILEILPFAVSGSIPMSFAAVSILIQSSMILILVPSGLSALQLIKGKLFRWVPLIISYFVLIFISLYITDLFMIILNTPEAETNTGTAFLTLASLVVFSIAYMYLSSFMYKRALQKRDLI
ncbi:hypothetical protein [Corticicoccus populi]|uniref:ABC-2 transporter permease n=1 Tax=Corticicoccus populi TaxID=1812821 RepID=A0ABW5WWH9_9STAP